MRYKIILFLSLLLPACAVYGQSVDSPSSEQAQPPLKPSASAEAETASSHEFSGEKAYEQDRIDVRRLDKNVWKDVVGTTDYTEEKSTAKKKPYARDSSYAESSKSGKRIQPADNDDLDLAQSTVSPITRLLLTIVAYAGAIGLIGYILFLIIKNIPSTATPKIIRPNLPDHSARIEDIKELEIDKLLSPEIFGWPSGFIF